MEEQPVQPQPENQASAQKPPKKQVHPIVTIVALLLVLVFVGWQYVLNFGMPRFGKKRPVGEIVMEKVKATGGDINKLSKQDRDQLNDVTMGNGDKYFKIYAKQLADQKSKPH